MKKIFTLLILLSIISVFPIQQVSAVEYGGLGGKPAYPDPDNSRTKSIFIFTLEPGEELEDGVLVVNNTPETKTILVYATDSQRSSDGSFACEQFADTKDSVGTWITMEKQEITLESGTNEIVKFKIKAPLNASVGEENGCILVQEKKPQDPNATGVTLSFRTGLRVVATIPGEQLRKLSIADFSAHLETIDRKDENGNVTKVELMLSNLTLKNDGNVSIDAKVHLSMQSIFGYKHYEQDNQYPVLRADIATINFEIPKPKWGGIFTTYSNIEYDPSTQSSVGVDSASENTILKSRRITTIVIPKLPYLLIEVAVLLIILSILYLILKRSLDLRIAQKTWQPYQIRVGDTINSIANAHGVSWSKLAKVNKISAPYTLEIGQKIIVPLRKA